MSNRLSSFEARRSVLRGAVVGCFLLAGAESAPCTSSSVVQITVDSAQAADTAVEAVSCTGGVFSVEWLGDIALPSVFSISGGTVLSVYGGSAGEDVIDGALATQLFSVSDAELNLEGVSLTGGFVESSDEYVGVETTDGSTIDAAPGGGAISATDSVVTMTDCVVAGNVAENGGAVFLNASHLDIAGVTAFENNEADGSGGAIFAIASSTITVEGEADFSYNSGSFARDVGGGGAIEFSMSSTLTIPGKARFHGNSGGFGGAVTWWINSFFNVTGEVEFTDNRAVTGGALNVGGKDFVTSLSLEGRVNFYNNSATGNGGALSMLFGGDVSIGGEVNFTENSAADEGGAISVASSGILRFEDSAAIRFTANECGANGGGIALWTSTGLSAGGDNVRFVGNVAGDSGGAIYARAVTLFVVGGRFLFAGNRAENSGGAVNALVASNFRLQGGAEFRDNSARVGGAVVVTSSGAGASTSEGDINLDDYASVSECTFSANTAEEDGGALYLGSGFASVTDCVFEDNVAGRAAGALSVSGVLAQFDNCSFFANHAPAGPAVLSIGTVSEDEPTYLEFGSNSLVCDDGQFIDYADPVLSEEAAASFNVSAERYMVDCDGCPSWDLCTNCSVLADVRTPACAAVLDHTASLEGTGTLETLDLERGYWRATDTSKIILSCFNEDACEGGAAAGGYCATGYEGPYCAVCEEGYAPGISYGCNSCSDGGSLMATAVVLILVAVVVVVAILLDLTAMGEGWSATTSRRGFGARFGRLKAFIPFHSLKIAVVSWQIITQFSQVASAVYPESYERFLSIVSVSNLDLARLLSAGCLVSTDFYDRLLFSTLGPIAVLAVLACTYNVATWRNRGAAGGASRAAIVNKHTSVMLLVAFLVYGSVSATVFGMFACEDLDGGGSYLRGDYSVRCDTDKHRLFQGYAVFMIFIYPIGIPALFAVLLFSHRRALVDSSDTRDDNPTIKPFANLWQPYRPERYMFELLEYLRRILLTGIVVFIFPNTAAQIAVTFMMELFFFVVSVFLLPYKKRFDAWLSHISHVVVLVSLYLALLLKVDIADETDDSQEIFAGVLVAVHCCMILSIIAEAMLVTYEVFGTRSGANGHHGGRGSPTREIKLPLEPSSRRSASIFALEASEEEETGHETFAEFQRRQQGVQAQPASSSSMPPSRSAEIEIRPPPPSYHPRHPASPYG